MTTEPEAIPADVGPVKPLDLSTLLRHAFLAGRGLTGEFDKLSEADQAAWVDYDPTELKPFKRITAALDRASRAPVDGAGWRPIETAPKDGTHILAKLHRAACDDMDDRRQPAFTEIREIFYRPYTQFGMDLPWHAGDPMDSHEGLAPDHMGEAVPIAWMPLPAAPGTHPGTVDGAEAKPVAWRWHGPRGGWIYDDERPRWWSEPVYTHPAPASPDAEMVEALSGLVKAIGSMGVPQNVADVARLVMVTLGPALSHAQDILSKHGGDRS